MMRFLVVFVFQVPLCCCLHEANVMYCVLFVDSGGFPFVRKVVWETSWLLGLPEDWPWVICRVVDIQYMGDSEDKCQYHLCYSSSIWWRYVHFYIYD
jgi:hypothetical protein